MAAWGIRRADFANREKVTLYLPKQVIKRMRQEKENQSRYVEGLIYEDEPGWRVEVEKALKEKERK